MFTQQFVQLNAYLLDSMVVFNGMKATQREPFSKNIRTICVSYRNNDEKNLDDNCVASFNGGMLG